jgi:RNA polymerase sigma-54 factor
MPRLIEPDVAFVKHGDEWLVIMNDEDLPQLRLNPAYKKLVTRDGTNEKSTRDYVKERYKSAIQLIKNIEQRKQTITKVCYCIVARQQDFLERGIDQLKPMMIKEVAEEIGVHPSTVSRAVASKYAHTPQGVFELRYFFSESVQGPEGGGTSLLILKRRVKKLIEEEDPGRPLDRRADHPHPAIARHPGDSPHSGQISRRHAHPEHAPAQGEEVNWVIV